MTVSKKGFLDDLYNQYGEFEVCCLPAEKGLKWTEWLKAREDDTFLAKINNRSVLDVEVMLDLEEPERYDSLIKDLDSDGLFYKAYDTGSRGYHISIIFPELRNKSAEKRTEIKSYIVKKYGCDHMKASKRNMIALEHTAHFKTGKPKTLVKEKKGHNSLNPILLEMKERKDKEEKEKIKSFLLEKRAKYNSLGYGLKDGVYYFGTKLYKEGRDYTAIVTSQKDIFIDRTERYRNAIIGENEIKKKFGLKYKDDFYDEALDHTLSNRAIEMFVYGGTDRITFKYVFDKVVALLKRYIYFENEVKYSLVACYRIASYFVAVWKARARLFIYAEFGSSKSRLTNILHNTGFNSLNLGDWTLSFLQRIIQSTGGETHIDDFESLDEEKKKATIRLVKVGYMKGFKAGKTADRSRKPEVFELFNTTTLNNTEGLDFISNDRCITIRIPKIEDSKFDQEPDFEDPIYAEIRDELYILALKFIEDVARLYPTIKSDKLSGRTFSIIKPELTIAKLISNSLFDEILDFWSEEIQQRDTRELSDNWEFRGYHLIYDMVVNNSKTDYFGVLDDVVKPLITDMYGQDMTRKDMDKKKLQISQVIGKSLSRSPIFKKRTVNGKTQYKVKSEDFVRLLKAKKLLQYIQEYNSTNTTNTTNSINSTNSTEKVGLGEFVESKTYKHTNKEEDVIVKEESVSDLLNLIKDNDGGDGVGIQKISELMKFDTFDELITELDTLKERGDIAEIKSNTFKAL